MAQQKISFVQLERLVRDGNSVSQIAQKLGVTKGAVSKAMKKLALAVSKDVALRAAPEIVNGKIDAMAQLRRVNESITRELDYIEDQIQGTSEEKRRSWQDQKLKHTGEIRKQLSLLLDIAATLYNAEEVAAFQQTVIEEIGHAAPEVREAILRRLNEARFVRSTLGLHPAL